MELKPAKGLRVVVNARREAVFGDESVSVHKTAIGEGGREGIMTGSVLAGFCEIDMPRLDGCRHWYPVEDLVGEHGERIVEEEVPVELEDERDETGDET
jgi:hypothetical protein